MMLAGAADRNQKVGSFTAHNVRFDDGSYTISPDHYLIAEHPRFKSVKALLKLIYQDNLTGKTIVDLGCLEGGYTIEFARLGLKATGIEVRESNISNCNEVKDRSGLQNVRFVKDDVLNVGTYGPFDITFCCGLLYHLESPREFLKALGEVTTSVLILNTHYAPYSMAGSVFTLSEMTRHEGLEGRWYQEHNLTPGQELDELKWASWKNRESFWPTKESLFHSMREAGFDFLFEHIDSYGDDVLTSMRSQEFLENHRATFVGLKTSNFVADGG